MEKSLRSFLPVFKIEDAETYEPPKILSPSATTDQVVEKSTDWWKYDKYTNVGRVKKVKWFGHTIFSFAPSYKNIVDNYFTPANDFVQLIKTMQAEGIVFPLDNNSKVFEPGCSVGRNLYYLQEEFNCHVTGLDISPKAIDIAQNEIWSNRSNYDFHVGNTLTTNLFDQMADNSFDLVFTRWHLIHLPRSDAKSRYINNLKRIARVLVLLEPVKEGVNETFLRHNGEYTLSWDDWSSEYDLQEFELPPQQHFGNGTRVFWAKLQ